MSGVFGKGKIHGFTNLSYCNLHDEDTPLGYYVYKGCWNCYHFDKSKDFPFADVKEASEILGVSKSTIYKMIELDELDAILFERGRETTGKYGRRLILGARKKWHIAKDCLK